MGARRKGNKHSEEQSEWQQWVRAHQELIDASGLPPLYVSTEEHWNYFLDHQTLFYFEEDFPPFDFDHLSLYQQSAFTRLVLLRGDLDTRAGRGFVARLLDHIDTLPRKKPDAPNS